ncbi:helix-turn-helix domain-containing protein [Nocardia sp. 348MFTsu5.1]|uniref:helix-turn-helix domain-containing protein n=1 Tax=Nocardia sp. 348MFTsu5.1 TaxID=1172185 RepID=UPI00037795E7|nr:helix-turn-helix domain-containing protein [Nocardia sp. 348MFTsu5.1]
MSTAPPTTAPTTVDTTRLLTTGQLGERLGGLTIQTIRRWVAVEGLPCHRIMRRLYFDPDAVDTWLRERHAQPNDDAERRASIRALVDAAPTLTADQAAQIRTVLSGGVK